MKKWLRGLDGIRIAAALAIVVFGLIALAFDDVIKRDLSVESALGCLAILACTRR